MAKRIAIVEDEIAIRENYVAAFKREGYAVDAYEARGPALEAFAARLPDLVVIDINLKDDVEGGFELCRELRARAPDLPIIFLTARQRIRRRVWPAPGCRRLPDQGHKLAPPHGTYRGTVPAPGCDVETASSEKPDYAR